MTQDPLLSAKGTEMAKAKQSRHVVLGIGAAMAGSAVFSLNDLCIKQLSGAYALHQVILVRGLVGVAFILAFAALSGQRQVWRTTRPMMHLIRA